VSIQQRIEQNALGRAAISVFLVVTLIAIVVVNLPESVLRRRLIGPVQPYLNATGLDQNWALFAPEPRRSILDLDAVVHYDDGSTAVWRFPHQNAVIGQYRDYRWRKWAENAVNGTANRGVLLPPAALYAAAEMQRSGRRITSVAVRSHVALLNPPGKQPRAQRTQVDAMYTARFTGAGANAR
jgi:hypothetical protein